MHRSETQSAAGPVESTSGTMLIGELARLSGASARSLRHYESQGLITSDRDANGYRHYAASTVEVVQRIRRLLRAGFSLESVRVILPCLLDTDRPLQMCPAVAAQIRSLVADLDCRAEELQRRRESVEALIGDADAPAGAPVDH